MTNLHIIGLVVTLLVVLALSIYSGKAVKKAKDASGFLISGALLGTLIGGSSTVGTAQLAYMYGMSAWWFTLGGGIACLVLALFYVKPFLKSGNKTIMAFIRNEYGEKSGLWASSLSSVGSFINILSQLISATAVISVGWCRATYSPLNDCLPWQCLPELSFRDILVSALQRVSLRQPGFTVSVRSSRHRLCTQCA